MNTTREMIENETRKLRAVMAVEKYVDEHLVDIEDAQVNWVVMSEIRQKGVNFSIPVHFDGRYRDAAVNETVVYDVHVSSMNDQCEVSHEISPVHFIVLETYSFEEL